MLEADFAERIERFFRRIVEWDWTFDGMLDQVWAFLKYHATAYGWVGIAVIVVVVIGILLADRVTSHATGLILASLWRSTVGAVIMGAGAAIVFVAMRTVDFSVATLRSFGRLVLHLVRPPPPPPGNEP